jgi:hypothetical protein
MSGGFAGELTRLDCDGQFKPFVYLNVRASRFRQAGFGNRKADNCSFAA